MTEKRGMEIENRQAQDLSLTKFMPIPIASCGQACCQDIFCRLSLSYHPQAHVDDDQRLLQSSVSIRKGLAITILKRGNTIIFDNVK